jgi:hypothetical protein
LLFQSCYRSIIATDGDIRMSRWAVILLIALGAMFCSVESARATTSVQVLATDPSGDSVTLARNQNFYLHLHYQSDRPVGIWVQPYFQGKPADAGSNPSGTWPAGSGEAFGWFFLNTPGARVDEVRISAGDGSINGTHVVATYPVQVSETGQSAPSGPQPEWVTRLTAQQQAQQQADDQQRMDTPVSAGDAVLFDGLMLAMFATGLIGFAGPAWGLWRWRGGWRWAAAVPAAIMALAVLRLLIDAMIDPTSHNLWPFEILVFGALSAAIMLVLALARKVGGVRT